jgi:ubiquitin carboxyl-terminal hydrolase 7
MKHANSDKEQQLAEESTELARRKEEREKAHLYLDVGLISDESFRHHRGFDLTSADLAPSDPAAPKIYRILRTTKVSDFADQIAKERNMKPGQIRFWEMTTRMNKTIRPGNPLLHHNLNLTVEMIYKQYPKGGKFYLWVEVTEMAQDGKISWPEGQGRYGSILLFLKHFDGLNLTAPGTGVGHVYVRKNDKIGSLSSHIIKTMNWPAGTQLLFFEVTSEIECEYSETDWISNRKSNRI